MISIRFLWHPKAFTLRKLKRNSTISQCVWALEIWYLFHCSNCCWSLKIKFKGLRAYLWFKWLNGILFLRVDQVIRCEYIHWCFSFIFSFACSRRISINKITCILCLQSHCRFRPCKWTLIICWCLRLSVIWISRL